MTSTGTAGLRWTQAASRRRTACSPGPSRSPAALVPQPPADPGTLSDDRAFIQKTGRRSRPDKPRSRADRWRRRRRTQERVGADKTAQVQSSQRRRKPSIPMPRSRARGSNGMEVPDVQIHLAGLAAISLVACGGALPAADSGLPPPGEPIEIVGPDEFSDPGRLSGSISEIAIWRTTSISPSPVRRLSHSEIWRPEGGNPDGFRCRVPRRGGDARHRRLDGGCLRNGPDPAAGQGDAAIPVGRRGSGCAREHDLGQVGRVRLRLPRPDRRRRRLHVRATGGRRAGDLRGAARGWVRPGSWWRCPTSSRVLRPPGEWRTATSTTFRARSRARTAC